MKQIWKRLISILLCVVMVFGLLPANVIAIDPPVGESDGLILEFDSAEHLYEFLTTHAGAHLGGNMLLVAGSYEEAVYYERQAGIASVTYNYTLEAASYNGEYDTEPDDTYFPEQLYPGSNEVWYQLANIADSMTDFAYTTVRVGVVDTGIDGTHEDLVNRVVAGYDVRLDEDIAAGTNSDISYESHGTKVAGLIAAEAYNGKGIAGVAGLFPVDLVPIRALDENGEGKLADIVKAIYWAIDNDIDILNMSFGARLSYYPVALGKAVQAANAAGLWLIAAAGNEGDMTFEGYYPAGVDGVYAVVAAATTTGDTKASYSNEPIYKDSYYTGRTYSGACGTDLWTTSAGNAYEQFTGTSASCAVITGYIAAMATVTGGRDNPYAYDDMKYIMYKAHYKNYYGILNYYGIGEGYMRSGMSEMITQELLDRKNTKVRASIDCDDPISGTARITALLSAGQSLVGDATLLVYQNDELVYTSGHIANDGTDPDTYTFTVDTTELKDGPAEVQVRFRTADEVANDDYVEYVSNLAYRTVSVRNSLVSDQATVRVYDADGNEIHTNIQVFDPTTGEPVAELTCNDQTGDAENTVARSLFNGGELTFTVSGSGMLYSLTTAFAEEIVLGEDPQITDLVFADDTVTLGNAPVYAATAAGPVQIGTTDAEGRLAVAMMDGTYTLQLVDSEKRYFLSVDAVQDGSRMELDFADAISETVDFTVAAANHLSAHDYFSLGLSSTEVDKLSDTVVFAWLRSDENVVHITPGRYYMMVGIHDALFPSGSELQPEEHQYYDMVHIPGFVDTDTTSAIDFDPTILKAHMSADSYEVFYGSDLYLTFMLTDDQDYPIIGGRVYTPHQFGTISADDRWLLGYSVDIEDTDGNILYGAMEYDTTWGCLKTASNYDPLPYEEAAYRLTLSYYLYDTMDGYTDVFSYTTQTVSEEVQVKLGQTLTVTAEIPDGFDSHEIWEVLALVDGSQQTLAVFSDESDGVNSICTVDASKIADGTPILVSMYACESGDDESREYYYYHLTEYVSGQDIQVKMPDSFGSYVMTCGGDYLESGYIRIPADGGFFRYQLPASSWGTAYVPAGNYSVTGLSYGGYNDETGTETYLAYAEEVEIVAGQMTTIEFDPALCRNTQIVCENRWLSTVSFELEVNGEKIALPRMDYIPDQFTMACSDSVDAFFLSFSYSELEESDDHRVESGETLLFYGMVDFSQPQVYLCDGGITSFSAVPPVGVTSDDDVFVELQALALEGLLLRRLRNVLLEKRYLDDDRVNYDLISTVLWDYTPTARFRIPGGEWANVENVDWSGAYLGQLGEGEYEIEFFLPADENTGLKEQYTYGSFSVGGGAPTHRISVSAPAESTGEVQLAVTGVPGASVSLHSTDPNGVEQILHEITLPASGLYRVIQTLELEGTYKFWAVSTCETDGISDTLTSDVVTVLCDRKIPAQIGNFRVTRQGSGALLLSWDPSGADRVWIYRDGQQLGYVSGDVTSYLDEGADADRIYTYKIIPESEAGAFGEASFISARPSHTVDANVPTAPAQLQAQSSGMSVELNWTRGSDDVRVASYRVYRDGVLIADTQKRAYTDEGLYTSTTYTYTVTTVDSSGNESGHSPAASVTTAEHYTLAAFTASVATNRLGAITGMALELFADAGRAADRVWAEIVYEEKDAAGVEKTATVELAVSGKYWKTDWPLDNVLMIKSVTGCASEGADAYAPVPVPGFPAEISRSLTVDLTVFNAPYAKYALSDAALILTDTENGLTWRKQINAEQEQNTYVFNNLSTGKYALSVMIDYETVYHSGEFSYTVGGSNRLHVELEGFIRIKLESGEQPFLYRELSENRLTEDNYLTDGMDSAFYVKHSLNLRRVCSDNVYYNGKLYRIPEYFQITRVSGVHEYAVPNYDGFEEIPAAEYRVHVTAPSSGSSVQGLVISLNGNDFSAQAVVGSDGWAVFFIPADAVVISAQLEQTELSDESGSIIASFPAQSVDLTGTETEFALLENETESFTFTLEGLKECAGVRATLMLDERSYPITFSADGTFTGEFVWDHRLAVLDFDAGLYGDEYLRAKSFYFSKNTHTFKLEPLNTVTRYVHIKLVNKAGVDLTGTRIRLTSSLESKEFTLDDSCVIQTEIHALAYETKITVESTDIQTNPNVYGIQNTRASYVESPEDPAIEVHVNVKVRIMLDNPEEDIRYLCFLYDRADLTKTMSVTLLEKNLIDLDTRNFPADGITAVLLPVATGTYLTASGITEIPLDSLTGFDAATIVEYEDQRELSAISLKEVKRVPIGSMTDLQGEQINSRVYLHRYVDDVCIYYAYARRGLDWILWDWDSDTPLVLPEVVKSQALYEQYQEHIGTFAFRPELKADSAPFSLRFGFQNTYQFRIAQSDGTDRQGATPLLNVFGDKKVSASYQNLEISFLVSSPVTDYAIFAAWADGAMDSTISNMFSFWDENEHATRYDLDVTKTSSKPIVLVCDGDSLIRLSRITHELNMDVKSVTRAADDSGDYLIRLRLTGASRYDSLITLPEGSTNVILEGVAADTQLHLPMGQKSYDVSFRISEEALEADNQVERYVVKDGKRYLQFSDSINYDLFIFEYRDQISTNEVVLDPQSWSPYYSSHVPEGEYVSKFVDVTCLSYPFGRYFGDIGLGKDGFADKMTASTTGSGASSTRAIRGVTLGFPGSHKSDISKNMSLESYRLRGASFDYGLKTVWAKDGAWIMFRSATDDFGISIRVNGTDLNYGLPKWVRDQVGDVTNEGSILGGWYTDEGDKAFYNSAAVLEAYGMYDADSGEGALFIPLGMEPQSYPFDYDIELRFKYRNSKGEVDVLTYPDECITLYYDAPVLKKWSFQHYGRDGIQESGDIYNAIQSYEERKAYEASGTKNSMQLDWNGTDLFTFYAHFDKPEDVCNVYAIAVVDPSCKNYCFPLEYSEELGCFTGTGILGDVLNPPESLFVHYEYVDTQFYEDMPTVQLDALQKNMENLQKIPTSKNVDYSAPENGWTLEETYDAWELYKQLIADGELSEADIQAVTDGNGRLYYPKANFYDGNGEFLASRQDYVDFNAENENYLDFAIMDGSSYHGTLGINCEVLDENNITLRMTCTDPALLLPEATQSADASSRLSRNRFGQKQLRPMVSVGPALGKGIQYASNILTGKSTFDTAKTGIDDAFNSDWTDYLTPEQFQAYQQYKTISNAIVVLETIVGVINPVAGIVCGVMDIGLQLFGPDITGKYKEMAELNRQRLEQERNMLRYRLRNVPGDICPSYHIDPSGYIFEGHEDNRLEGVTATVYYQADDGSWIKWDSEAYDEGPNPNISDADGKYGWDVLIGKWKVIFEKDGYYVTESEELDVPPPHMDVNVGMVALNAASLTGTSAGAMGAYIDFTFDRPVLVEDVLKKASVLFGGMAQEGTIEALDAGLTSNGNKQASCDHNLTAGLTVARTFRFTPEEAFEVGSSVCVSIDAGVLTYNGLECEAFEGEYVLIPDQIADPITAIFYEGVHELAIGDTLDLNVDLVVTGTEGSLVWTALNPDIATVTADGMVTAVSSGNAYFKASCGEITGMAWVSIAEPVHKCVFDQQNPLVQYLVFEGAEDEASIYYYSCVCGNAGHETWLYFTGQSVQSIVLSNEAISLETGDTFQLIADVFPENATNKRLNWISQDPTIAAVSSTGLVTAVSKGTTVITVSSTDGSQIQVNCVVEVTDTGLSVSDFVDVAADAFFYDPVKWAVENGITLGTSATTFGPNNQCTRAQVVTFLWRAMGSPKPTRTDNPFVDVASTDFYYDAVLWAVESGITVGLDATHFGPNRYCNRAQVVTFLHRTLGKPEHTATSNPFVDVESGSFYEKPVLWAVEQQITLGLDTTHFGPNSICNRAQIVTFLYRALAD